MKCQTCNSVPVGAGFFKRVVHEKTCPRIKVARETVKQYNFPNPPVRCDLCKENMTERGVMCDDCWKEIKGKP